MAVSDTNYNSTLAVTDVVNSTTPDTATAVKDAGMSQGALYTLLNSIVTNVNAMNAKLDSDGGVTDTDYAATYNLTTLASRGITANGMDQDDVVTALTQIETNWNAILTKLDSDAGTADNDYNSLHAVDLNDLVSTKGVSQDNIVTFLDSVVTQLNAALTKLDSD